MKLGLVCFADEIRRLGVGDIARQLVGVPVREGVDIANHAGLPVRPVADARYDQDLSDALLRELSLLSRLGRELYKELDSDRLVELLLGAAHRELGFDAFEFWGWRGKDIEAVARAARVSSRKAPASIAATA